MRVSLFYGWVCCAVWILYVFSYFSILKWELLLNSVEINPTIIAIITVITKYDGSNNLQGKKAKRNAHKKKLNRIESEKGKKKTNKICVQFRFRFWSLDAMRQYFNHFGHCTVHESKRREREESEAEIAKCLYILLLKCHKVYSLIEHFENFFFVRCVLMRECAQFQSVIYTFRCVPYNTNCIHYLFSLLKLLLFSRFFWLFFHSKFLCALA